MKWETHSDEPTSPMTYQLCSSLQPSDLIAHCQCFTEPKFTSVSLLSSSPVQAAAAPIATKEKDDKSAVRYLPITKLQTASSS